MFISYRRVVFNTTDRMTAQASCSEMHLDGFTVRSNKVPFGNELDPNDRVRAKRSVYIAALVDGR